MRWRRASTKSNERERKSNYIKNELNGDEFIELEPEVQKKIILSHIRLKRQIFFISPYCDLIKIKALKSY